jgi:hypothetical protein
MKEGNIKQMSGEEQRKFNRRFKYAIYAYAAIEFVVIVFAIYYKIYR